MKFFEIIEDGIIFRNNGETVRLRAWGEDSFRLESVYLGEIPESSAALLPAVPQKVAAEVTGEWDAVLVNGKLAAKLHVIEWGHALEISYYNSRGDLLIKDIANGGALQKRARYYRPLAGGGCYIKASFEALDEKIYGMGQYQQEVMDLKGCNLELAHRNSQASVPFYISSRGYGFLWNNGAVGSVHFGKNTTEWEAQSSKKFDYWITAGETPKDIERHYADATGHVPMMPDFGLGFWQCKLRYFSQDEILEIARGYYERKVPIDVIVADFYHWPRCGDWRFDPEYFPDPKAMVDELKSMGIELMVSIWPQVDVRSENYQEMKQQGLLVRNNGGVDVQMIFNGNNSFIDATNPRAREYMWEKVKKNYADLGIKIYWLDEAEPEFGTYDFEQYRYHIGPVVEEGNVYPREYSRIFYEGQKADGQDDVMNLVRCAFAGSQRYGALVWSGDIYSSYEDFRKQICAGIHMGVAGIPWWTTDIGGFHGGDIRSDEFKELLIRWFQFGAFCPVMRIHGDRRPFTPIINSVGENREHTGADNEIWSYGPENERIMTKFITIRGLMKNYIKATMRQAHEDGEPVMRACFYEFPGDPACYDLTDEYLFGSDILVAPVVYPGARERRVYLPKGAAWQDARSGQFFAGGQWINAPAVLDTLPVFLRDGHQNYLIGKI